MAIKAAIISRNIDHIAFRVADVAVLHLSYDKVGFLPFDQMIRGKIEPAPSNMVMPKGFTVRLIICTQSNMIDIETNIIAAFIAMFEYFKFVLINLRG